MVVIEEDGVSGKCNFNLAWMFLGPTIDLELSQIPMISLRIANSVLAGESNGLGFVIQPLYTLFFG